MSMPRTMVMGLVMLTGGQRAYAAEAHVSARLVDVQAKAMKHSATVEVKVEGVELVDPAASGEKATAGQAHLHYQVDDGMVIATTAPKLSFHELRAGQHHIKVTLAANDHSTIVSAETLTVSVP